MKSIKSKLLMTSGRSMETIGLEQTLNNRFRNLGLVWESAPAPRDNAKSYSCAGLTLTVSFNSKPLPTSDLSQATDGLLSRRFPGLLTDTIARHSQHVVLTLTMTDDFTAETEDAVTLMRLLHCATACVAEFLQPSAILWTDSNQLLLYRQYMELALEAEPWALFAKGVATGTHQIELRCNPDLSDTRIVAGTQGFDLETAYSACLTYLRTQVTTGHSLVSGQPFGPIGTAQATPSEPQKLDDGSSAIYLVLTAGQSEQAAPQKPSTAEGAARGNFVLSALLLVIMPPVGLVLMVTNQLLGFSLLRSSAIAIGSLTLALFVAGWMVANENAQVAGALRPSVLIDPE